MISLLFQVVEKETAQNILHHFLKEFLISCLLLLGGSPVPSICGTNTGAHMYIDMGLGNICALID